MPSATAAAEGMRLLFKKPPTTNNDGGDHRIRSVQFSSPKGGQEAPSAAARAGGSGATTANKPATDYRNMLLRHDSEFSVGTEYTAGTEGDPRLSVWRGAALLTAECLGTGLLALPGNVQVLGLGLGVGFLLANLPVNLYAGTILHRVAQAVEERQSSENRIYQQMSGIVIRMDNKADDTILERDDEDEDGDVDYEEINQNTCTSVLSALTLDDGLLRDGGGNNHRPDYCTMNQGTLQSNFSLATAGTSHTLLHHDTATNDFIGMARAVFPRGRSAARLFRLIYYTNLFLVMGNYILVMSHAVAAVFGDEICLPLAGIVATAGMFAVSQMRSMASLGQSASFLSLGALAIVVGQCLWALHNVDTNTAAEEEQYLADNDSTSGELPSASSRPYTYLRRLTAIGSIGFACSGQKLFLNIRHDLSNRSEAPTTLALAIAAFGIFYVAIILLAGPNPPALLFDAIPRGPSRRIAGMLLWGHVVVSYAINSQAICSSLDRLTFHRLLPGRDSPAIRWLTLTGMMSVTAYTVANTIPFFDDLVALIGGLTGVPLTLLLPALFYRKHLSVPLWWPTVDSVCSALLTYFSILFMVTATAGALHSIAVDWGNHGAPFSCN